MTPSWQPSPRCVRVFPPLRGPHDTHLDEHFVDCPAHNSLRTLLSRLPRLQAAAVNGLVLEANACANAAGTNGRPKPWMAVEVARALDAWPLCACVKVDDTLPGIGEGRSAGMWTVGVAKSGNELGLDEHEAAALAPAQLAEKLAAARVRFQGAGAHYVIDSVADLLPVIEDIEARIKAGETPLGAS